MNLETYTGISWSHEFDCYSLMQRFYTEQFEIEMPDFARPAFWWARNPELDLIRNNFRSVGFLPVDDKPQLGDIICMSIGCSTLNHLAALVEPGRILHLPFREKSRVDIYAGTWTDRTMCVIRHPRVFIPQHKAEVQLIDLLPEHKRRLIRERLERAGRTDLI